MRETAFLKPAAGLKVRHQDPRRGHVDPDGEEIVLTSFYRRRLADGDLVRAKRPAKPKNEEKS